MRRCLGLMVSAVIVVSLDAATPVLSLAAKNWSVSELLSGGSNYSARSVKIHPKALTATTWEFEVPVGFPDGQVDYNGNPYCYIGYYYDPNEADQGYWLPFYAPCSAGYVTTPYRTSILGKSAISFALQTVLISGAPTFGYQTEHGNICEYPAHARLYFQRDGDDLSGQGPFEFYRWWAISDAYELNTFTPAVITVTLDPANWSSVFGKHGDYDASVTQAFFDALAHLKVIGFTLGGGCWYGHGTYVENGLAKLQLLDFKVQ